MLNANERESLSEQLRPPHGYRLKQAVGTTFTLDMVSALAIPLSFIKGSGEDPENSVAVINAVRKVSDRIDIFSQAGLMRVPHQANDLLTVLEPMLHQVLPPKRGALFHPKIWLVEYESGEHLVYRFLCSSRNLTPDASWDLLVRLDGRMPDPEEAPTDPIDNGPLARFVTALPGMAIHDLNPDRQTRISSLAQRVVAAKWELPPDIRTLAFRVFGTGEVVPADSLATLLGRSEHAVGLNGHSDNRRSFGPTKLLLSPFVDDATVTALSDKLTQRVDVFGRGEELDKLSPKTLNDPKITFHAFNEIGIEDEEEPDTSDEIDDLRGLHAKAVFTDFDRTTHVLLGSANATQAAFHRNVEFCVEMTGPKTMIGIDQIRASLESLRFLPYDGHGGVEVTEESAVEFRLQNALIQAASHKFLLDASRTLGRDDYEICIEHFYSPSSGFKAKLGLLTLPHQLTAIGSTATTQRHFFSNLPLESVTPFVLIQLTDVESGISRSTVVQGLLRTDAEGRIDKIIANQLNSPEKLRAFLLLFLTPEDSSPQSSLGGPLGRVGVSLAEGGMGFSGLFEAIAAATADPGAAKLFADVEPVLKQLYAMTDEDSDLAEIRILWEAAVAAVKGP
ncbi:phospholipase D family protein [Paeniglutamicibacter gangotriensis]|uniref:PLD phosphodiesterase domain-containing protein n=1 Tax=Paeniglutamicibacter gangotriensis TaxID=254787 RepID=A0A5B0E8K3_9MICC|nr:phospholipase D family protein [Paeniglutamicibacter gangotriensis]KAA0974181.1 hypothetical protein FQ154_16215 [Paeniglutamicibacter gangotriensis]